MIMYKGKAEDNIEAMGFFRMAMAYYTFGQSPELFPQKQDSAHLLEEMIVYKLGQAMLTVFTECKDGMWPWVQVNNHLIALNSPDVARNEEALAVYKKSWEDLRLRKVIETVMTADETWQTTLSTKTFMDIVEKFALTGVPAMPAMSHTDKKAMSVLSSALDMAAVWAGGEAREKLFKPDTLFMTQHKLGVTAAKKLAHLKREIVFNVGANMRDSFRNASLWVKLDDNRGRGGRLDAIHPDIIDSDVFEAALDFRSLNDGSHVLTRLDSYANDFRSTQTIPLIVQAWEQLMKWRLIHTHVNEAGEKFIALSADAVEQVGRVFAPEQLVPKESQPAP